MQSSNNNCNIYDIKLHFYPVSLVEFVKKNTTIMPPPMILPMELWLDPNYEKYKARNYQK